MRREWIGILLMTLLLLPARLWSQEAPSSPPTEPHSETQCRKRILVYLDVSLSMKAHYADALSGLEELFREPGFIGPADAVTFVQFGKERGITVSGEGPTAASELITRLRSQVKWSLETDFRAAFNHLAEELPKGIFNRQVALFASDFAHEPINGMKSDPAIADWQGTLSKATADLRERFASSKKTKMLLYKADASGENPRKTAEQVIADLKSNFSAIEYVGNPSDLAGELRRSLLDPPVLQVSRDPEDTTKLRFAVTNPNCYPLHVVRISAEPAAGGEAENFEIDGEEGTLAGRGSQKTIKRTVPAGEEWRVADVRATVETLETVPADYTGTTGNWLKFKAVAAVFERRVWPLRDVLRLDLELTGYTDPATTVPYAITLGEDADPFAQGSFEAPVFSGSEPQDYRILLPLKRRGERAESVRVEIGRAEASAAGGDRVVLVEDALASHRNRVLAFTAMLALIGFLGGFFWVRQTVEPYPVFQLRRWRFMIWVILGLLGVLLNLGVWWRIWLLHRQNPVALEWWLGVSVAIVIFILSSLLILRVVQASFARFTVSGDPKPLRKYLFRSRLGNVAALVVGAVLAGIFAIFWAQSGPAETQEMRRNAKPSSLHITSD